MNVFRRQTLHNAARSEALLALEIAAPTFQDDYHKRSDSATKLLSGKERPWVITYLMMVMTTAVVVIISILMHGPHPP